MEVDLTDLREMHVRLPVDMAALLVERAGLALARNSHAPGVRISLELERLRETGRLSWPPAAMDRIDQHDRNRITEDGAEAVALAVVYRYRSLCVLRRLQREEHADWLLEGFAEGRRTLAAFEISGVDRGSVASRLHEKLKQVGHCSDVDERWAGVIGFEEPIAALESAKEAV